MHQAETELSLALKGWKEGRDNEEDENWLSKMSPDSVPRGWP